MKLGNVPTNYYIKDENGKFIGLSMMFYAPRAELVEKNGRVVKVDMESDNFEGFLREATQ